MTRTIKKTKKKKKKAINISASTQVAATYFYIDIVEELEKAASMEPLHAET